MKTPDHPGLAVSPCRPPWLTDEGYSHQAFNTFSSLSVPHTHTHTHTHSIVNTRSAQSPKTNGQTSNTYIHNLRKTEWEGGWERRERQSVVYQRERERSNFMSLSLFLSSPSLPLSFFKTNAQSSSREKYSVLGRRLHLLLWGFIWVLSGPVCMHVCVYVCACV